MLDWKKKSGKSQTSDASTRRKTREKKRGRSLFAIDHNRRRRDWYTKSIQRARVNSCVSIETLLGRHCPVVPWELIRNRRGTGSRPMDNCDYDLWSISGPPSIILHSDTRDHKVSRTCNFHFAMFRFNSTDIWRTMLLWGELRRYPSSILNDEKMEYRNSWWYRDTRGKLGDN